MRTILFIGLSAFAAAAAGQDRSGGYIGGEIGSFSYEESLSFVLPGESFDESSTAIKLFGGYRFGDYVGVEADWRNIDDLEESRSFFVPDIGNVASTFGAEIDAITIRVLGYLPLSWGSLFLGGGYFDYDADVYARIFIPGEPAFAIGESTSDSGGTAILGLQWALDSVDVRVNYEYFNFEDADVDQISVGAAYRFR